MEELEKIIRQVINSAFCNRMIEEDACEILISACKIAMNTHINVPYITTTPYPYYTDVDSLKTNGVEKGVYPTCITNNNND